MLWGAYSAPHKPPRTRVLNTLDPRLRNGID